MASLPHAPPLDEAAPRAWRRLHGLVAGALMALTIAGAHAQGTEAVFPGLPLVAAAPVTHQPPLPYPVEAQKRGREGRVVVAFLVGTDGVPERYRIIEADPPLLFDAVVKAAAPDFRFAPAVQDGKPARYETRIILSFKPQSDAAAK
jgi:protein TonB